MTAFAHANAVLVTAIVPTFNEEATIGRAIEDLLGQEALAGAIEILVVDGGSSDRTCAIVQAFMARGCDVRLLDNPARHQAAAYNIGIRHARGTIVTILHARVQIDRRYIATCLEVKHRTGAANVGGVVEHFGLGATGRAIALAMSSPFGVGDSKYRHSTVEGQVDSVMGAFAHRTLFDDVGLFNETNVVNEDGEFNYRVRKAGRAVLVSPSIRLRYQVRSSLSKLAQQYVRYGFYRRWTAMQHPGSMPLRVYAPPLLLAGLLFSAIALTAGFRFGAILPLAYGAFLLAAFARALMKSQDAFAAPIVPVAIAVMHCSFAAGWLWGSVCLRKPRGSNGAAQA
jgi:succinoglycan biosynthesis protein ExoA